MAIDMLAVIENELEDRTIQAEESGESELYQDELKGLKELKLKVENKLPLTHPEYEWLADLSAGQREEEVRSQNGW
jgi:hypothetical protein